MARAASRRSIMPPVLPWTATLNAHGVWVLVDREGIDPMRHPIPIERCYNVHLAARAPTLRAALEIIARRYQTFESPYKRDDAMVRLAFGEIMASRPPLPEVVRMQDRGAGHQSEIDLAA